MTNDRIKQEPLFSERYGYLAKALSLLSKRPTPDYENMVKEANAAVGALFMEKNGDRGATLGAVVKKKRPAQKSEGWDRKNVGMGKL